MDYFLAAFAGTFISTIAVIVIFVIVVVVMGGIVGVVACYNIVMLEVI